MAQTSHAIELPAGRVLYRETGKGKPIVFVHGHLVDGRLWDGVADALSDRMRCFAVDWPMGSHRTPMNPDADLSPYGFAAMIASFLDQLDLADVTVVGNDSGGAIAQVLVTRHPERIGHLVLTNCDTHENFPPGIFKVGPVLAKLPGGMTALAMPLRTRVGARGAVKFFTKRKLPFELVASWMGPVTKDRGVRRDVKKVTAGMKKRYTLEAAERLREQDLPILLAWAPEDPVFDIKYARRLAEEAPNAKVVEIPDSKTYVSLDQPQRLAKEIANFVA